MKKKHEVTRQGEELCECMCEKGSTEKMQDFVVCSCTNKSLVHFKLQGS